MERPKDSGVGAAEWGASPNDSPIVKKGPKTPLAIQSDKMDYQTKKAREGDPIGPYLSHLTSQIPASK